MQLTIVFHNGKFTYLPRYKVFVLSTENNTTSGAILEKYYSIKKVNFWLPFVKNEQLY